MHASAEDNAVMLSSEVAWVDNGIVCCFVGGESDDTAGGRRHVENACDVSAAIGAIPMSAAAVTAYMRMTS